MLRGSENIIQTFNAVGLGPMSRYVIGSIEVIAALFLFTPRLAGVGALLLCGIMVFTIIALRSIPRQSILHAVFLLIVVFGRKERIFLLIGY